MSGWLWKVWEIGVHPYVCLGSDWKGMSYTYGIPPIWKAQVMPLYEFLKAQHLWTCHSNSPAWIDKARNPALNTHIWLESLGQSKGCYSQDIPSYSVTQQHQSALVNVHVLPFSAPKGSQQQHSSEKMRVIEQNGEHQRLKEVKALGNWCGLSLISCQIFIYRLSMKIPMNFLILIFSLCHKESIFFHWGQWVYQNYAQFLSKRRIHKGEICCDFQGKARELTWGFWR